MPTLLDDEIVAGTLIIVGVIIFMLCWHIAEFLYPGYSVSMNFISDLGATCRNSQCQIINPSATIFNYAVAFLGLTILLSSYPIYRVFRKIHVTLPIAATGIGSLGVGIFPETAGVIHTVFSLITFMGAGLAMLSTAKILKGPTRIFSVILGLTTLTSLILFASGNYLGIGPGGMERLIVYPALIWALIFGGYLCKSQEDSR